MTVARQKNTQKKQQRPILLLAVLWTLPSVGQVPALDIASLEARLARLQAQSATLNQDADNQIAKLSDNSTPIGLTEALATQSVPTLNDTTPVPTPQVSAINNDGVSDSKPSDSEMSDNIALTPLQPSAVLPAYDASASVPTAHVVVDDRVERRPNPIRYLYDRVVNGGVTSARIKAAIYVAEPPPPTAIPVSPEAAGAIASTEALVPIAFEVNNKPTVSPTFNTDNMQRADTKQQPYKNIAAALENITTESTPSFSTALPRLKTVVESAGRAVGYYDMEFRLENAGNGIINVLIDRLGEPVIVADKILDIRGQAAELPAFVAVEDNAETLLTGVFNHGDYEQVKADISQLQGEKGFFDGRFLDHSVDVLLPDNTADVSLVYASGNRYSFDEVVFFTIDPKTGEFTTDPDKLPVNLSLLEQLVTFEPGEGYDREQVARLSGDLIATRYFNTTNVETVLPEKAGVNSEISDGADSEQTDIAENEETLAYIAPIDFSPSEDLLSKLQAVRNKAERLYNSPNDRVLASNPKTATSLLGRISERVKSIVQAVLPDGEEETSVPEEVAVPVLTGRKTPAEVLADKKVPLYVFVSADKPRDAQIGLGWGSDTGARFTGRFENNLINKEGMQAEVELSLSQIDKGANVFVSRPLTHPLNDKLTANAKYYEQDITQKNDAELTTKLLELGVARNILRPNAWDTTYALRYRQDDIKSTGKVNLEQLPIFSAGARHQRAILAGVAATNTVQNHPLSPTQGYRQYYALEAGGQSLGSDTNMVIARAGLGGLWSFGDNAYGKKRANQIIGRLDGGYIWASDFFAVPYKLRFFAGGDQSIRGYNYQSISPVSQEGYLTGGQVLAVGSLEYNREVREGLRAAVFADYGGAFDKQFTNPAKLGVGVGLRYASPIGTVRVDVAKGVESDKTPIRLHFLIGLPF